MRWPGSRRLGPPHRALGGHYGWNIEQGYQQRKEELGLAHFEGRSWRGFHHHVCLVMLAYGFLALEQLRAKRDPVQPGKKGIPGRRSPSRRSVAPCSGC